MQGRRLTTEERVASRQRRRARDRGRTAGRRALLAALKLDAGCSGCGYREHACALQFHHRPGVVKVRCVGTMMTASIATLQAEIDKCEILCANCHAVRTYVQR